MRVMKLYATTTSERASKGQGGNRYIDIELMQGSAKASHSEYFIRYTTDGIEIYADGVLIFQTGKGERQKGKCIHEWKDAICTKCGFVAPGY